VLHCVSALYHDRNTVDWTRWRLQTTAQRDPAPRSCIGHRAQVLDWAPHLLGPALGTVVAWRFHSDCLVVRVWILLLFCDSVPIDGMATYCQLAERLVLFVECYNSWEVKYSWSFEESACYAVPSPRGALLGLDPPNKAPSPPPNWNMKHCKLVEFLPNLSVNPHCTGVNPPSTNVKPLYWRLSVDGSADGSANTCPKFRENLTKTSKHLPTPYIVWCDPVVPCNIWSFLIFSKKIVLINCLFLALWVIFWWG